MKKILTIILAALLLCGCRSGSGRLAKTDPSRVINMLNERNSFVLYVTRVGCESCRGFEQTAEDIIRDYAVTLYYIPVEDGENEELNALVDSSLGYLELVPTIYLIKNGRVIDRHDGSIGYNEFADWLRENGYINE